MKTNFTAKVCVTKWNDGYRVGWIRDDWKVDYVEAYIQSPVFAQLTGAMAYAPTIHPNCLIQMINESVGEYPKSNHTIICYAGVYVTRPMSAEDAEQGQCADYISQVWCDVKEHMNDLYGEKNVAMDTEDHEKHEVNSAEYDDYRGYTPHVRE